MTGDYSFVLQWVALIVGIMTGDHSFVLQWGAVAQWLRYCFTNRKVAGSIPDGVTGILY